MPSLVEQPPGLRCLAVSFTDLLDQRVLVTRQLKRRDLEWSLWLLRPLGHIFMRLPDNVWEGAKVIVELPENVYKLLTRGNSAALDIKDIEPGIDWTGGVVQVEGGRWVYRITVVYVTAAGEVKSRVFDTFEIKEGPRSDLIWREGDDGQRSRVKERFPERWGGFASVEEHRGAYAEVMRDGEVGKGVEVL